MKIIKNIIVAFSLYSQIPMPGFEWTQEDMKHNIVFLPWIGAVIGLLSFGLFRVLLIVEVPLLCKVALYSLIPLVVSGGFHVDGYMDVQDALRSYKSKEEKLLILKDPHIGAFAIIRIGIYGLIFMAALSAILDRGKSPCLYAYFVIFALARAAAAFSSLVLPRAKKDGMLNMETKECSKADSFGCAFQILLAVALLLWIHPLQGLLIAGTVLAHYFWYKNLCYRQFGGVTGDTAGFCVTSLEEWLLVVIAAVSVFVL